MHTFRFKYDGPSTLGVHSVSFLGPHRDVVLDALRQKGTDIASLTVATMAEWRCTYFVTLRIRAMYDSVRRQEDFMGKGYFKWK